MNICFSDLETANEEPITSGSYKYAETVRVQLWAYAIDDGPVRVWDVDAGDEMPAELRQALQDDSVMFCWHNSGFDRIQLRSLGVELSVERIIDTMVIAYQHGLPGSLGKLCEVYKLSEDLAKQKRGRYLVQLFCKPRPKSSKIRWATRHTHPKEWAEYLDYATHDVLAMRELYKRMPITNRQVERGIWFLDQAINDRGYAIDTALVDGAISAVAESKARLADECRELTGGLVEAATQRDALLKSIANDYAIYLPDMKSSTIERALETMELPAPVRELLLNRLQASATGVGKYVKVLASINADERLRGTLQYCGAGRTGRWSGRLVQPQNFPRPYIRDPIASLKQGKDVGYEDDELDVVIEAGIDAIKHNLADQFFDNVIDLCNSALRGLVVPTKGHKLIVSDLSAIEGRILPWLAGEEWRVQAFRDYDTGNGYDDYVMTYAKAFNEDPADVKGTKRQIGKVKALMLGYGGAVGAFVAGAATFRLDLDKLAESARPVIDPRIWDEATSYLAWVKEKGLPRYGLSDNTYIACDSLKRLWREANPATARPRSKANAAAPGFWYRIEDAVLASLKRPGVPVPCGRVTVTTEGKWTHIRLPSGRSLCYPQMKAEQNPYGREELAFMGVNQYTRKWGRIKTYGGKLTENIVQAISRDILAWSMRRIEEAGYRILFTVHDELVTEAPDTNVYSAEALSSLMTSGEAWSEGLPLSAHGFESYRYKKG